MAKKLNNDTVLTELVQDYFKNLKKAGYRGFLNLNEPLDLHTTWRVGGPALGLAVAEDRDELELLFKEMPSQIPWKIIGSGSNLLIADHGYTGIICKLGKGFSTFKTDDEKVTVGGAFKLPKLARLAAEHSLTGLEWAEGIPGTVGGALKSNAGAFGSDLGSLVERVLIKAESGTRAEKPRFSYRNSSLRPSDIILEASFILRPGSAEKSLELMLDYRTRRASAQPKGASAGSVFKNASQESAWKLIDNAGCRGIRIGDAMVSEKHCNFIMNTGSASASDILAVILEIKKRVFEQTGKNLELEIETLGFDGDL